MGNEINVGHLLQLQTDLTRAINEAVGSAKDELREDLAALKQKQDISNGRVGRLEMLQVSMRARFERLERNGGSVLHLSKAQKVKLSGLIVLVAGALAEGLHRLIPVVVAALTTKAGQ